METFFTRTLLATALSLGVFCAHANTATGTIDGTIEITPVCVITSVPTININTSVSVISAGALYDIGTLTIECQGLKPTEFISVQSQNAQLRNNIVHPVLGTALYTTFLLDRNGTELPTRRDGERGVSTFSNQLGVFVAKNATASALAMADINLSYPFDILILE